MKIINVRGTVLREYEAGESDKRLLLLCKGVGRLFVYARGARKPKSKFIAAAQLFTYADFTLAEGRGFYSLTHATPIEPFYHLRNDYDALTCAHVIAEICEKTVLENENCDGLLQLTLKALTHLNRTGAAGGNTEGEALASPLSDVTPLPPLQVLAVFMLRFFAWYGVAPVTNACHVCGEALADNKRYDIISSGLIHFCAEGLSCEKHLLPHPAESLLLSPAAAAALHYICTNEPAQAFRFTAAPTVVREIKEAAFLLWRHHFDVHLRAAGFVL